VCLGIACPFRNPQSPKRLPVVGESKVFDPGNVKKEEEEEEEACLWVAK
jgi:hypothetical protein